MPIDITMPRLSDTMESGTIIRWNVKEGDTVSAGDIIADVETDKATMEMTAFDDGTVAAVKVGEGEQVDVGTVIAVLTAADEDPSSIDESRGASSSSSGGASASSGPSDDGNDERSDVDAGSGTATATASTSSSSDGASAVSSGGGQRSTASSSVDTASSNGTSSTRSESSKTDDRRDGRLRVSPVARRLAEDHDLDLRSIQGSGPSGRIIKRDVLSAVEASEETAASVVPSGGVERSITPRRVTSGAPTMITMPGSVLEPGDAPLTNMRQTIANRLVESSQTIPEYQVTVRLDMDPLLEMRKDLNRQLESLDIKLSVNDFLVKACALAIHKHPAFNASWGGDHLVYHDAVNIGVAVALPEERGGGLVVATIRHADQKSLRIISAETRMLASKARDRGLTVEEMSDSTFTISNLGMFGVEHFTAIINPPNSAILAVGAALEEPVVRDGELGVGHVMRATLTLDHRIIDGAMAASFLQTLRTMVEQPGSLVV